MKDSPLTRMLGDQGLCMGHGHEIIPQDPTAFQVIFHVELIGAFGGGLVTVGKLSEYLHSQGATVFLNFRYP